MPGSQLFEALELPPQRVAISFPERALTYTELRNASLRVASALTGAGRAAVLADTSPETCVAVFGALLAGVPI
ncbi:MAG TPA: AMP-binding protein, partial [Solirubrobacteraceae bacterium]|nr:AMP-binding protein [Solirubrobacteraceae bacterium]